MQDELIRRQVVLDLAKKGVLVSNGNYDSVCKAINEIPFVNLVPCEDAISREAAIDACDQSINLFEAVDRIKELPSVTQNSDNKYRKKAKRWKNKWLKAQKSGKWIPVSERLPEEDGDYFVTYEKGYAEDYNLPPIGIVGFEVDCESFGYWHEHFDRQTLGSLGSEWEEIKVVAWMPLPEPYKVDRSE